MMRRLRLTLFVLTLILAMSSGPAVCLAATAQVENLVSPTHPVGQWVSSADPSFEWDCSIIDWHPTIVGSYNTPGYAFGVAVSGTTAYVADWDSGLQVIDVTNPSSPALLGTYNTPGYAFGAVVSGTTAYVADGYRGVQILDVLDPSAPVLLGTYDTPGDAYGIAVSGTTVYVADYQTGLQIIDAANPSAPVLLGTCDTPGDARAIAVSGTTVYVADEYSGLQVIDVTNPSAPVLLGGYDTPDYAFGVAVSGTTVYVADYHTGLMIIDAANPSAPVLLGTCDTPGVACKVAVSGTTAYVADHTSGLQVIDVADPSAPVLLDTCDTPVCAFGVAVSGATAYIGDSIGGLRAIDLGPPHVGFSYEIAAATVTPDNVSEGDARSVSLHVPEDGVWYFGVRPVADMETNTAWVTVHIDTTPPNASITPTSTCAVDAIELVVSAADTLSGVDVVYCAVDGGSAEETDTVYLDTVGDHTIEYWAIDTAGNESVHATHDVRIGRHETRRIQVGGTNRYTTAVEASRRAFPTGADTVVIGTGANWPDALGGSALAGVYDAPVLLTEPDSLAPAVASEIERLAPDHVVLLGGTGVISRKVEDEVRALLPGAGVERLWGADRIETSEVIARRVARDSVRFDGTAFLATARTFPDALAAAPLATALERPLYLADTDGISRRTIQAMRDTGVTDVVILGGTAAVPWNVESQLAVAGIACTRIVGADRYTTAAGIATHGIAAGMTWDCSALACGTAFPDALSGGVMQGHDGAVLLLTGSDALDPSVAATLRAQRNVISEFRLLGGAAAVSQTVRDEAAQLLW